MIIDLIKSFVLYYGGWQAVLIAIITYFFYRFAERLKVKWERDAAEKIEKMKGDVQRELNLTTTLLSNAFYGHQKFVERRIEAVELLWKSVLQIPKVADPIYLCFIILADDEIENKKFSEKILRVLDAYDMNDHLKEIADTDERLNEARPFIGEKLFYLFSVYRTTILRSTDLLARHRQSDKIVVWHKDVGIRTILGTLYSEDDIKQIVDRKVSTLHMMRGRMETDILHEMSEIMRGSTSITEGIENYEKLRAELEKLNTQLAKSYDG